jgi:hypothetical protein
MLVHHQDDLEVRVGNKQSLYNKQQPCHTDKYFGYLHQYVFINSLPFPKDNNGVRA